MNNMAARASYGLDCTLIIDKSGSMATRDMPRGQTRWEAAKESTYALAAKMFELDANGIDIWVFSNKNKCYPSVKPEKVSQIFQENEPCGGTAMADVLKNALDAYFSKRDTGGSKEGGDLIFVVTDGEPDSQGDVTDVLVKASQRLRFSDNLAVHFIQVGNDSTATQFLKFLDEELVPKHKVSYDFIKTIKIGDMENNGLTQTILDLVRETEESKKGCRRL